MNRSIYLCAFILLVPDLCLSQSVRDSILFLERSIDRPVNLHGGQLRITTGYGLSSITKSFDEEGNGIKLREKGISYVRHSFPIDIRYGILEYLEVGISTVYKRQTQREEEILSAAGFVFTNLFQIYERNGFEDLSVTLKARAPLRTRKIDILLHAGAQLPVGSGKSEQPENTFSQQTISASTLRNIIYKSKPKWGNGTTIGNVGGTLKARTHYYAITIEVDFAHAMEESENDLWSHQLIGTQFEYQSRPYRYFLADELTYDVVIERQLAPWFDLAFQFYGVKTSGGWTEDNGVKVKRSESSQFGFSPGYELLVTPKIWLRQQIFFTVSGKNSESPFSFNTAVVYNFFPFSR